MLEEIILWTLTVLGAIVVLSMLFSTSDVPNSSKKKSNDEVTVNFTYDNKAKEAFDFLKDAKRVEIESDSFENDEVVMMLLKFDDARLREIIENTLLYKDECRDKARKILARRTSWERIKEYSDKDLMRIITTDKDLYDDSMQGAASMELYNRLSPLLYEEIRSMSYDTIKQIANGNLKTPEGIRLAARKYLSSSNTL
ncbi:MAG: hypothetical protein K2I25_04285 [Muribaculaceae bacterium]|nr:hypothetical protein [Muribaculaceae bacterium]